MDGESEYGDICDMCLESKREFYPDVPPAEWCRGCGLHEQVG